MLRFVLLVLVAVGLAPGTFVRTPTGLRGDSAEVSVTRLAPGGGTSGALALAGVWELTAGHGWFGGFSALAAGEGQTLAAATDRGFLFAIDVAGGAPLPVPGSFRFVGRQVGPRKEMLDLEALARDPATGTLWAAFENFNAIERFAPDGRRRLVFPPAMRRWSSNSGPETMERLADGRFLVLAEGAERRGMADRPALLFPGDPLEGAAPIAFRFESGPDYDPVDAAQLPDGRVLILLRRVEYALPARFDTAIAIADPRAIRAGATWRAAIIQRLSGPLLGENFEGLAFVPDPADPERGALWVIADDNFSAFQRSLLLRFDWAPGAASSAPSPGRRPTKKRPEIPDASPIGR